MAPQKKIQHLRKKNKILLEKLESHSSQIEVTLKSLKRTLRGRGIVSKSPPCAEAKHKAWCKRNDSIQVTEAISYDIHNQNVDASEKRFCYHPVDVQDRSDKKREGVKDFRAVERDSTNSKHLNFTRKSNDVSSFKHLKQVHDRPTGFDSISRNSKTIREIVSLIDYSPKSAFVKKMKSKYKPYIQEAGKRCANNEVDLGVDNLEARENTSVIKLARPEKKYKAVSTHSICTVCKDVEKEPFDKSLVDGHNEKVKGIRRKEKHLEKLKTFREENWEDCHSCPCKCDSCHCSRPQKCNEVYGINDRLFAVPLEHCCENLVYCPLCKHKKCEQTCCGNSKQVIVTIPMSYMDVNDFAVPKGSHKSNHQGSKENVPVSGELMKKLQRRPKPENSMALRYQKGVH